MDAQLRTSPVELSPLTADPWGRLCRQPPRPKALRQPGYEEEFDWFTIFYDVFRSADGKAVVLLGPPLRNLLSSVQRAVQKAFGVRRWALTIRNIDRHSQIWLPSDASAVAFDGVAMQRRVAVQPNCCEVFRGKRVIFTKSKDNDLQWIQDWASFHVRHHGCNAVLIYDNDSTRYGKADVERALSGVPGLDAIVVVSWPYKFGPDGGKSPSWDSDFSQYGVLEHARHRFLAFAEACVSGDVDELVLTSDRSSVFDSVAGSSTGYISYRGVWVENVRAEPPDAPRRHAQFRYRLARNATPVESKWAAVPSRCPAGAQWRIHDVTGMDSDKRVSEGVSLRHFKAINTNWRTERWRPEPLTADHVLDAQLAEWLDRFAG